MNHLRRHLAPVPDSAWIQIDDEATRSLKLYLAARRVIDVAGPVGWDNDAVTTGLVAPVAPAVAGIVAGVRQPLAMAELRTPFSLSLSDVDSADRGNPAIDTDPIIAAARTAAEAEDHVVFHGLPGSGMAGMVAESPYDEIPLTPDAENYPQPVAQAVKVLRDAGIGGPYTIALGDPEYTKAVETTEHGGYPVLEHLRSVVGGEVVWAPALEGAVVLSTRGGDFELTIGQDFSIGYSGQSDDSVQLYLEESIGFRVLTPGAAVHLSRSV